MKYCLECLEKLVSFDTVSGTPPERDRPNTPLIDWMKAELARLGCRVVEQRVAEGKLNLYAQLGGDPDHFAGLLLTGHSDTVACNAERWESAPWTLSVRDGRVYGLGSCDMKGFIASAMALMQRRKAAGRIPANGLALLVTCDEETSMQGARAAAPWLKAAGAAPSLVVVGEPTELTPIFGHKGFMGERAVITGKAAHSSDPRQGVNALKTASVLIESLNTLERAMQMKPDPDFDQPGRSGVPWPTLNLGAIRGGDSVNRVCAEVTLDFDVRPMPLWDADAVNRQLAGIAQSVTAQGGAAVRIEALYPDIPPFSNSDAGVRKAVEAIAGRPGEFVSYCTEAGFMQELGPTVVMGPGSIAQAHGVDEFTELAQLEQAATLLDALAEHFAA